MDEVGMQSYQGSRKDIVSDWVASIACGSILYRLFCVSLFSNYYLQTIKYFCPAIVYNMVALFILNQNCTLPS